MHTGLGGYERLNTSLIATVILIALLVGVPGSGQPSPDTEVQMHGIGDSLDVPIDEIGTDTGLGRAEKPNNGEPSDYTSVPTASLATGATLIYQEMASYWKTASLTSRAT